MLDLRSLVPTMAALDVGRPLNFLAAEAIAAAVLLDGSLVVSATSPLIEQAAAQLGLTCQLVQS